MVFAWSDMDSMLTFLSASCVVKFLVAYVNQGKRPASARQVGVVAKIQVYPVKAMRSIDSEVAECTRAGPKILGQPVYDRLVIISVVGTTRGQHYPKHPRNGRIIRIGTRGLFLYNSRV